MTERKNAKSAHSRTRVREEAEFELRPDPRNYRTHNERNKEIIRKSLAENGAGRSIVVDSTGAAIAGSGVLEQAESLELPKRIIETDGTELVVVVRKDITPDDPRRKSLALADNAATDLSEWDLPLIAEDFGAEAAEWGVDIPTLDDALADLPELADGAHGDFEEMNFILTREQAETIREGIRGMKQSADFDARGAASGNENGNGNAIAFIVEDWLKCHG